MRVGAQNEDGGVLYAEEMQVAVPEQERVLFPAHEEAQRMKQGCVRRVFAFHRFGVSGLHGCVDEGPQVELTFSVDESGQLGWMRDRFEKARARVIRGEERTCQRNQINEKQGEGGDHCGVVSEEAQKDQPAVGDLFGQIELLYWLTSGLVGRSFCHRGLIHTRLLLMGVHIENPVFFEFRIPYCARAGETTSSPLRNAGKKSRCQMGFTLAFESYAWIEPGQGEVGQEIPDDEGQGQHHQDAASQVDVLAEQGSQQQRADQG